MAGGSPARLLPACWPPSATPPLGRRGGAAALDEAGPEICPAMAGFLYKAWVREGWEGWAWVRQVEAAWEPSFSR